MAARVRAETDASGPSAWGSGLLARGSKGYGLGGLGRLARSFGLGALGPGARGPAVRCRGVPAAVRVALRTRCSPSSGCRGLVAAGLLHGLRRGVHRQRDGLRQDTHPLRLAELPPRGRRSTVEIVLFEISNSMKPYPSVFHACTNRLRPVKGFVEPNKLDEVSNRILPTSHPPACMPAPLSVHLPVPQPAAVPVPLPPVCASPPVPPLVPEPLPVQAPSML